jgi:hypothetical protein
MLVSMKHTSEALQTMGMKVSDADNIMLDLMTETDLSDELALCDFVSILFVVT